LEKNPLVLPEGRGGKVILKYAQERNYSARAELTQRKENTQPQPSLTFVGERKHPTPTPSCLPVSHKGGERNGDSLVKSTAQRQRYTRRLRSNHRTIECFPSPAPHINKVPVQQERQIKGTRGNCSL